MSFDVNLLNEIQLDLKANNVTESEIEWVGTNKAWYSWEEFKPIAQEINYDAGFGSDEINETLIIVGKDWWLERHEYDGSEWFEFKKLPTREQRTKEVPTKERIHSPWR